MWVLNGLTAMKSERVLPAFGHTRNKDQTNLLEERGNGKSAYITRRNTKK